MGENCCCLEVRWVKKVSMRLWDWASARPIPIQDEELGFVPNFFLICQVCMWAPTLTVISEGLSAE